MHFYYLLVMRRVCVVRRVALTRAVWWWPLRGSSKETHSSAEGPHRVARKQPLWQGALIFAGLLIFFNGISAVYYAANRWYQRWRPSGNDIYVTDTIDERLFARPDLAVAAVRMALHHALSNAQTPFGAPMVAPTSCRVEAEQLADMVWALHTAQPAYSLPDLWVLVTTKALARLGGPLVEVTRGRQDGVTCNTRDTMLVYRPSLVPEDSRDVLRMKRVLALQGFTVSELVALVACTRCLGLHEAADFHTTQEVQPKLKNGQDNITSTPPLLPETTAKCVVDPYVFSSSYFDLLLDYHWHVTAHTERRPWQLWQRSTQEGTVYRCSADDKRREVVLLEPLAEKRLERQLLWRQKGNNAVVDEVKVESDEGEGGVRSGEAQLIPAVRARQAKEATESQAHHVIDESAVESVPAKPNATLVDSCQHISMRGVDVMLLDDALTQGWLRHFSRNELDFYSAVGDVLLALQRRGHNVNLLFKV